MQSALMEVLFFSLLVRACQEVEWANFNNRQPQGSACRVCLSTCVEAWPSLSFQEFAQKFHDKTQKEYRAAVQAARAVKSARLQGKPVPDFLPATYVRNDSSTAYVVSFEVGFLSAAEVERVLGISATAVGLGKPVTLLLEDCATYQKGYFMSLRGMPAAHVRGLRTVRMERRVSVAMSEELMQPKQQLRKGQEQDVFDYVASTFIKNKCPTHPGKRMHLPLYEALVEKARLINEAIGSLQG